MKAALILVISAVSLMCAPCARAGEVLLEGFEGESYWYGVDWENTGQVNLEAAAENASQGKRSLKVVVREEATEWKNKVAFFKETGGIDMSKDSAILIDVYNKEAAGIEIAIGFRTGEGWVYYESARKQAGKGWTKDISFDLNSPDYKCKASDWKYSVPLAGKGSVGEFYVLVYRPVKMAKDTVYIDNIRIK
ncbi:MAG: hypothetical protein WC481_03090 [Candidatus Omnitrophota bacterium]